jgi:hypothetical protein
MPYLLQPLANTVDCFVAFEAATIVPKRPIIVAAAKAASVEPLAAQAVRSRPSVVRTAAHSAIVPM